MLTFGVLFFEDGNSQLNVIDLLRQKLPKQNPYSLYFMRPVPLTSFVEYYAVGPSSAASRHMTSDGHSLSLTVS